VGETARSRRIRWSGQTPELAIGEAREVEDEHGEEARAEEVTRPT
jgi:hypothetical protein